MSTTLAVVLVAAVGLGMILLLFTIAQVSKRRVATVHPTHRHGDAHPPGIDPLTTGLLAGTVIGSASASEKPPQEKHRGAADGSGGDATWDSPQTKETQGGGTDSPAAAETGGGGFWSFLGFGGSESHDAGGADLGGGFDGGGGCDGGGGGGD